MGNVFNASILAETMLFVKLVTAWNIILIEITFPIESNAY
jgi:hypothetical protein